ncbi:MAG: outer-membrane lipoprotein carrier protein LolA [Byssovorax sp.]
MPIPSSVARRLSGLVVVTSLAALGLAGCTSHDDAGATTGTTSGGAMPDTSAPSASAVPVDSAVAPAASASASAAPVASTAPSAVAKPIADAGAPDAGRKTTKDAGAPAPSDAGAPTDAGAVTLSPAAALAKQIDAIYADKKTFSAKFKQEYVLKVSNQTKTSSGVVFIERPNKISFRYDAPNKNRIVSDGKTLKVYIAEDNQMIEKPVENSQYPGAFGFLMGNGISSSFTFTINDKAAWKDGPVLQGKPTSPTPDYEAATFFLNKVLLDKSDPGAIARVSLTDAQGNKNRFDLSDATRPATIDPGEFVFTAPPGTNIIH